MWEGLINQHPQVPNACKGINDNMIVWITIKRDLKRAHHL